MVYRVFTEKKPGFDQAAEALCRELNSFLGIRSLTRLRLLNRYDAEAITEEQFQKAIPAVFSEPQVDKACAAPELSDADAVFAVEYLPGQFDQRADSAAQCIQILFQSERPLIRSARVYALYGAVTAEEVEKIKRYVINPVEAREASLEKPETLHVDYELPDSVETLADFNALDDAGLAAFIAERGLAMDLDDIRFCRDYFRSEGRAPTITEIRIIDTYWSDHCRHTTFMTTIDEARFDDPEIQRTWEDYLALRRSLGRSKPVNLMDLGTIAAKALRAAGKLDKLDASEEINACTVKIEIEVDGRKEPWLLLFKNETHNHPTEIEPFGGAATCIGGAIRDPLSGRSYVYGAMRLTGAADPLAPVSETLPGKLPQRKIVTTAAHGYSSYGNQIGLATGLVNEIYHPNYVAKRMEIGAVIAAAPRRAVQRLTSDPGDIIILLGGRTGRDGIGGATGASKSHTTKSLTTCGAEVQKGNAPTERKIQRLFRREEVSHIIKKCNDFGAGGVSVAIGELADGLQINLDRVPKKYAGLDGTELAISESQERMAVVVDPKDVDLMLKYADEENLEATVVATVTEEPRMVINWRGKEIVNLSRRFIDTNGAHQETTVSVSMPEKGLKNSKDFKNIKDLWLKTIADLNVCSQKGLVEMFDSSIGAGSVVMPFGGKYQLTPTQSMIGKLPLLDGKCDTVTIMSYGMDPYQTSWSPFHGAVYAVLSSVAKIAAAGGDASRVRLTFQEYFKKLGNDPYRWGEPFAALLGAYNAQMGMKLPAIGGKDSMSGTFNDIDVPPTLCSFAVGISDLQHVVTPELKKAGNKLVLLDIKEKEFGMPDYEDALNQYAVLRKAIEAGQVKSAYALGFGGIIEAVSKMAFGNKLGVKLNTKQDLTAKHYGWIVVEVENANGLPFRSAELGEITAAPVFEYNGEKIALDEALAAWQGTLEGVFPTRSTSPISTITPSTPTNFDSIYLCKHKVAKPHVFIPAFPGTNCEYDSARAFNRAGAESEIIVFRNQNGQQIRESVDAYVKAINNSQIVMIPGGFSAGDEPEGSAKFITSVFRNAKIADAVMELLNKRDGLMLGICNDFQALVKLGLVPYGEIRPQAADAPTLTFNTIGRHQSKMAYTRITSNLSPWLRKAELGGVYTIPISHGEGRFVAPQQWLDRLFKNGQVATQYCNFDGVPTMDEEFNMNGSYMTIEGITSPDGRVLGKMGHSERRSKGSAMNIYGNDDQQIFESGVAYFK